MALELRFVLKLRVSINWVIEPLEIPSRAMLHIKQAPENVKTLKKKAIALKINYPTGANQNHTFLESVLSNKTTRPPRSPVARWSPYLSNSIAEIMSTEHQYRQHI